jgi:hypothetical protein
MKGFSLLGSEKDYVGYTTTIPKERAEAKEDMFWRYTDFSS